MGMPERSLVTKVVPATQFWKGRQGQKIDKVLIHVSQSDSLTSVENWFGTPGNGCKASANYAVGKDGAVTQFVSEADTSYAAGDWQWNISSISVEHVGWSGQPFTPVQLDKSAQLVARICRGYGIPLSSILPHSACPATTHKSCPGPTFNFNTYRQMVQHYMKLP